jgi:glycosyltransferase involved in cell wall biosynthesis
LHLLHDWGGGTQRWVEDYCRADVSRRNLALKSLVDASGVSRRLALLAHPAARRPIASWTLDPPIDACCPSHPGYARILREIIDQCGVQSLVVSSLIGHSLDSLRTELPTVAVIHDFFPFCPAIHATYRAARDASDAACRQCDPARLAVCLAENVHHRFFRAPSAEHWLVVRTRLAELACRPNVAWVAPSAFLIDRYTALEPRLSQARFRHIPHGIDLPRAGAASTPPVRDRWRMVILGALSPQKGLQLLNDAIGELTAIGDVYLLGCGPSGAAFASTPGVHVVPSYRRDELPERLRAIAPDCGLLLSAVDETFSYTLCELMAAGVPPVATRRGAFAERIEHGVDGFLVDPSPESLVAQVRDIASRPQWLAAVRRNLAGYRPATLGEMVSAYRELLPVSFNGEGRSGNEPCFRFSTADVEPVYATSGQTVESLLEELYAVAMNRIGSSPRLKRWQRPLARWALGGGYRLAKLACRLTQGRQGKRSAA